MVRVSPPIDGRHTDIVVNGRFYTCEIGQSIEVPSCDADIMKANEWTFTSTSTAIQVTEFPTLAIVADGDRQVLQMSVAATGDQMFVGPSGLTSDIALATNIRGPVGPATVVGLGTAQDPSANLTLDPSTGDVFQTTGATDGQ